MVHVVPMTYSASLAEVVVKLFMDTVCKLHGAPMNVVCNRDPRFRDAMAQEFVRLMGVKVASNTPYHPQSDGQAERSNHTVERMLRCYVVENQEDWDLWVTPVEYAIDDSASAATGYTPFELVYKRSSESLTSIAVLMASTVWRPIRLQHVLGPNSLQGPQAGLQALTLPGSARAPSVLSRSALLGPACLRPGYKEVRSEQQALEGPWCDGGADRLRR
eukprot:gene19162-biopygen19775